MICVEKFHRLFALSSFALLLLLCGCQGVSSSVNPQLNSINHVIFMVQENRSLDTYFGQLPAYWQANGYPQASQTSAFDGIPAGASNPSFDGTSTVSAFHVATECVQNLSPSWNESHIDWNRTEPTASTATMDGFVFNAASYAMNAPPDEAPIYDTAG